MRTWRRWFESVALSALCGACTPVAATGPRAEAPASLVTPTTEARPAFVAWPDLATAPATSADGSNDAALIVGVEDYLFVPKVPGAAKNATDWFTYLVDGRKVPVGQVKLLRNADATREDILASAREVSRLVKPGGAVWVVFIGHGAPSLDGNEGVLVGVDAQQKAASLYARGVKQSELSAALGGAPTVMVLDACFSGRSASGRSIAGDLQPTISARIVAGAAMTLLSAGKSDQFAGPLPGLSRPAFSYLVLGALRGWGDVDGDGVVTAQEAVDYAIKALTILPIGRAQTPELVGGNASFPLSRRATEKGPNLVAAVVAAAPEPGAAGFGEGLRALAPVPTMPASSALVESGSLGEADVALLELVQQARRAEMGSATATDKAAAWDRLAAYSKKNPYKDLAGKRRDEWKRLAEGEARQREQAAQACVQYEVDSAKLAKLLAMDDNVVSLQQKTAYIAELTRVYTPFEAAIAACAAARRPAPPAPPAPAAVVVAPRVIAAAPAELKRGMVPIPGGTFKMGFRKDTVVVSSFSIDVTEVTVAAYRACAKAGACSTTGIDEGMMGLGEFCNWDRSDWNRSDYEDHPINCVDWSQADAYCRWVGKRLPTEEEWERAATSGKGWKYPWGNTAPNHSRSCWQNAAGTCAVGSHPSGDSAQGVKDLAGNVEEWTASKHGASDRVSRGGSWYLPLLGMVEVEVDAFTPKYPSQKEQIDGTGFRCARSD